MGDGFWNPADYVFNRYENSSEQQKGKTLFGNAFTKNYNKIPQEAQDYINEQIQKRIDSGYKLTKWFLRALENHVKINWPDQVPYKWDISSFISSDKGMAKAINKQNNSKRVGNTQEQVANANPGDTVLYNGKTTALSENDINKAQQNTGINDSKTSVTGNAMEGDPRFVGKDTSNSSNAMENDPRYVGKEPEQQSKMTTDQKEQSTRQAGQAMQEYIKTQQNKDQALKQQSDDINQNTINEIDQGSTNVGNIATAVSDVSMPTMNNETTQDIHDLSPDEIKVKLKAADSEKGLAWANQYNNYYMEWNREKNNRDMSKKPKDKEKYEQSMAKYQEYMDNILKEAGLL